MKSQRQKVYRNRFLQAITQDFEIQRGTPLPLGSTLQRDGINFSIFAKHADQVSLVLFSPTEDEALAEFFFEQDINKTGDIWHALIRGLDQDTLYAFRVGSTRYNNNPLHRYDPSHLVLDPYAKAISGCDIWGKSKQSQFYRAIIVDEDFDWEHDKPLNIPLEDSIIYELHVRGFTKCLAPTELKQGSFAKLTEQIPYLKSLGITAVELLPIQEFNELDSDKFDPETGELLKNYWGYQTIGFFSPKSAYASEKTPGGQIREFKQMVKAFHQAGIEVILDVVFNHTAEGDHRGTTYSFRGIDNVTYYIVDPNTGEYHNYSGCGNTLNCDHPVVRDFILDCLRYWVIEMHVDGFRFDLASILGRGQKGEVLSNPPLLESIAADPVLAHTKLIAEAWDAAGLYQVGSFPAWGRWAEWNGHFRDDVRHFVKGDPGMAGILATRLAGSPDLYQHSYRNPGHSINFITCHDGFTLADLVTYNEKNNYRNGEDNYDGCNSNYSWNCGIEGSSTDPGIVSLRKQQMKNMLCLLLLANGAPMLLAGDEFARTQDGNNNIYCQDNELGWIDWSLADKNKDLLRFCQCLIHFRKEHAAFSRKSYFDKEGEHRVTLSWHGEHLSQPDWSEQSRCLALQLLSEVLEHPAQHYYLISNAHWERHYFNLPSLEGQHWHRVIDTSLASPDDIAEPGKEQRLTPEEHYIVNARSTVLLMGLAP